MAKVTLSLGERLMDDSVSLLGRHGCMAGLAQIGARLLQKPRIGGSMGIMTVGASAGFDRNVNVT